MTLRPAPPHRKTHREPLLTRARIAEVASILLQREGYEAVTMRGVAAELGVQAASLYWHVRGKEDLEDLVFDQLMSDADLAIAGSDWREDLRQIGCQIRSQLLRRRDATYILAGRFIVGPHLLRRMEVILGVLRRARLTDRDAAYAMHSLLVYVHGFVIFEAGPLSAAHAAGGDRRVALALVRRQLATFPADAYPHSVALAKHLTTADLNGRFQFGLDCLISGLNRRARQTAPGVRAKQRPVPARRAVCFAASPGHGRTDTH